MVAYCLLALITSLPCPHRVSIGFNCGDRFGNHNSVIPSASRREALAVWQGSSSSNRATCQPRWCDRTSPRNAWKSPLRPFSRGKNNRVPVRRFITPKITRRALRPLSQTLATSPRFDQAARNGGNSSRSVSSWANTTLRRGRARICRRMRRFFLSWQTWVEAAFLELAEVFGRVTTESSLLATRFPALVQLGTQPPPILHISCPQLQPFLRS